MNDKLLRQCHGLVSDNYLKHSSESLNQLQQQFSTLLSQRQLPKIGWDNSTIELFLNELSQMDSNNYHGNVGVGEREGRIYSDLVQQRSRYFSHGIGRSGDITANQPKATGSSIMYSLTNLLALHALKLAGATSIQQSLCLPLCTGMTLSLIFSTLKQKNKLGKFVIWSRIDQKSCLKSISTSNLDVQIVELSKFSNNLNIGFSHDIEGNMNNTKTNENELHHDERLKQIFEENSDALTTDMETLEKILKDKSTDNSIFEILCVMSTTSCFAPRLPDRVIDISKLCKKFNIPHIVNNAYGVQCRKTMNQISVACTEGRLDTFVQSMDKNFMVPVGGSIVASRDKGMIEAIGENYAGRASMQEVLDLFITLLSMGEQGWLQLLKDREELVGYFHKKIRDDIAEKFGEKILKTAKNSISFAITLDGFKDPKEIGSKLFYRNVSGCRVVDKLTKKEVCGHTFLGYGAHCNDYPSSYLTMACAIGIKKGEIDLFVQRLGQILESEDKLTK